MFFFPSDTAQTSFVFQVYLIFGIVSASSCDLGQEVGTRVPALTVQSARMHEATGRSMIYEANLEVDNNISGRKQRGYQGPRSTVCFYEFSFIFLAHTNPRFLIGSDVTCLQHLACPQDLQLIADPSSTAQSLSTSVFLPSSKA
jgi:hypothetical protein